MRHTKQTSYAVRILLRCPKNDEGYVRASDIARLEGITRYNVLKIMRSLLARASSPQIAAELEASSLLVLLARSILATFSALPSRPISRKNLGEGGYGS